MASVVVLPENRVTARLSDYLLFVAQDAMKRSGFGCQPPCLGFFMIGYWVFELQGSYFQLATCAPHMCWLKRLHKKCADAGLTANMSRRLHGMRVARCFWNAYCNSLRLVSHGHWH